MNSDSLGVRLKAARNGLGKSQDEMAAMCGVSREMWGKYERDIAMPGGDVLIKIALAGVDLNHLLTGQRSQPLAPEARPTVSEGDRILLDNFHAAPAQVQAGVKTALGAFAPAGADAGKRKPKAA